MSNILFVLLDGAEDDPCPQLDGKKPIDVAEMPFLESRVRHRCRTTGRGYTQLFLNEFFTGHPPEIGRATLEALGLGLRVSDPKRVAYRLSPVRRTGDGMVHWCYDNKAFEDELQERVMSHLDILSGRDPDIRFFVEGRSVLTMESDTVPTTPAPPVDAPWIDIDGPLGELIDAVAEDMDGITVYPWGCGRMGRQYPGFEGIRKLTAFSDSPASLGICASLGYDIELITGLEDRFPAAREALKRGDVFLHVDEVDEYSHQKDPFKKKAVLEETDRLMSEYFSDTDRIVYFADHGTSCVTGEHILTDVPVWTSFDIGGEDGEILDLPTLVPRICSHR